MQEHVFFISLSMLFGTVLAVFGIQAYAAVKKARAASVGAEAVASLAAIRTGVEEIKARLSAIEKILKEVE